MIESYLTQSVFWDRSYRLWWFFLSALALTVAIPVVADAKCKPFDGKCKTREAKEAAQRGKDKVAAGLKEVGKKVVEQANKHLPFLPDSGTAKDLVKLAKCLAPLRDTISKSVSGEFPRSLVKAFEEGPLRKAAMPNAAVLKRGLTRLGKQQQLNPWELTDELFAKEQWYPCFKEFTQPYLKRAQAKAEELGKLIRKEVDFAYEKTVKPHLQKKLAELFKEALKLLVGKQRTNQLIESAVRKHLYNETRFRAASKLIKDVDSALLGQGDLERALNEMRKTFGPEYRPKRLRFAFTVLKEVTHAKVDDWAKAGCDDLKYDEDKGAQVPGGQCLVEQLSQGTVTLLAEVKGLVDSACHVVSDQAFTALITAYGSGGFGLASRVSAAIVTVCAAVADHVTSKGQDFARGPGKDALLRAVRDGVPKLTRDFLERSEKALKPQLEKADDNFSDKLREMKNNPEAWAKLGLKADELVVGTFLMQINDDADRFTRIMTEHQQRTLELAEAAAKLKKGTAK